MCLLPLEEEAGWWKITAFPLGAEQSASPWHRDSNTKAAVKHGFDLAQGGSISGRAFHFKSCYVRSNLQFMAFRKICDIFM